MRGLPLLLVACIHEFAWQLFPAGVRGDVRDLTQWALISVLCLHVARASTRWVAACTAVVVMSSTTALCSAAWLIRPWPQEVGGESCSQQLGIPTMLISVVAATLAAFAITKRRE